MGITLAYLLSVGPSVLIMKNIVCLCLHCTTLARYAFWRWRLCSFRRQHLEVALAMDRSLPEEFLSVVREDDSGDNSDELTMLRGASQEFVHLYAEDIGGLWDPIRPPKVSADLGL